MKIVSANYNAFGDINVVLEDMPPGVSITVPVDPTNKDYIEIQEWVAAGNTIAPYVGPGAVVTSDRSNYDAMLERRMDAALDKGDTDAAFQLLLQLQG